MREGDRIVLCTDGVWGVIEDQEFADLAEARPDLESFNQAVLDEAIRRGSDDNLSLLTLHFNTLAGAPLASGTPSAMGLWLRKMFRI